MNADHIARRLAARFGGEAETLYAPALIGDAALRQALLDNETVRRSLDKARRADIALIGFGDMFEHGNMVHMGWFTPQEVAEAKRAGTVADITTSASNALSVLSLDRAMQQQRVPVA